MWGSLSKIKGVHFKQGGGCLKLSMAVAGFGSLCAQHLIDKLWGKV
jgi:hypothetical protein